MSEWLDLMIEEISRKRRESREAEEELERRNKIPDQSPDERPPTTDAAQSK